MRQKYCRLCDALMDNVENGEIRTCNTILLKTPQFVMLPSIGPLVCGHVLLASRAHYMSLASMPELAIAEYEELVRTLSSLPQIKGNILEAEHGPAGECMAGSCVAHTHVHLIPGLAAHHDFLNDKLPILRSVNKLTEIYGIAEPYIMVRGSSEKAVIFDAKLAPSQAIRRALCERLKDPAWDWRLIPRNEDIETTVRFWKQVLEHEKIA